jgi:hypothetical protein
MFVLVPRTRRQKEGRRVYQKVVVLLTTKCIRQRAKSESESRSRVGAKARAKSGVMNRREQSQSKSGERECQNIVFWS